MQSFDQAQFDNEVDRLYEAAIEAWTEERSDEDQYEEWLNDCYGDVDVCGISYPAGRALRELDPIAFRCGRNDYENSLLDVAEHMIDREDFEDEALENLNMRHWDDEEDDSDDDD